MISYYLPSGSKIGVGYQVHALANAMTERGHSVTVFSACEASEGSLYRTETLMIAGSNRTFKFALQLRKVDWSSFDILHAHGDDYWLWRRRVNCHVRTLHGSCLREAMAVSGTRERLRMALLGLISSLAPYLLGLCFDKLHSYGLGLTTIEVLLTCCAISMTLLPVYTYAIQRHPT